MEAFSFLGSLLKLASIIAPGIVERMAAKNQAITDYLENDKAAVQNDAMVTLSEDIDAADKAVDEEYKKRGL